MLWNPILGRKEIQPHHWEHHSMGDYYTWIFSNGKVVNIPLVLSVIVLIFLSISGTCSFGAHTFTCTPCLLIWSLTPSNSLLTNMTFTWKPCLLYNPITRASPSAKVCTFLESSFSMVVKCMFQNVVARNGNPPTSILLTASVINLWWFKISIGSSK